MTTEIPPSAPAQPAGTNSLALVSLIAGILGLTFFPLLGSILAVITGPLAKKEIRQGGSVQTGEEMATVGMVLGWIGIALTICGLCLAGVLILVPICMSLFMLQNPGWMHSMLFLF